MECLITCLHNRHWIAINLIDFTSEIVHRSNSNLSLCLPEIYWLFCIYYARYEGQFAQTSPKLCVHAVRPNQTGYFCDALAVASSTHSIMNQQHLTTSWLKLIVGKVTPLPCPVALALKTDTEQWNSMFPYNPVIVLNGTRFMWVSVEFCRLSKIILRDCNKFWLHFFVTKFIKSKFCKNHWGERCLIPPA